jgi:hypothetical protein
VSVDLWVPSRFADLTDKNTGEVATADIADGAITPVKASFDQAQGYKPSDSDLLLWNYDAALGTAGAAVVKGVQYFFKLRTGKAITVSNVILGLTAAGVTLSNCFVGLLDASGNLLTGSSDQSTPFQSTGVKTCALTTPQAIAADTVFYATVLIGNGSTTPPSLLRNGSPGAGGVVNGLLTAAHGYRFGQSGSALTALGAVALGSATAFSSTTWVGVS